MWILYLVRVNALARVKIIANHYASGGISVGQRITPNIGVEVDSAYNPDRILANEPLQYRIVISCPVVIEPRSIVFSAGVLDCVPVVRAEADGFTVCRVRVEIADALVIVRLSDHRHQGILQ